MLVGGGDAETRLLFADAAGGEDAIGRNIRIPSLAGVLWRIAGSIKAIAVDRAIGRRKIVAVNIVYGAFFIGRLSMRDSSVNWSAVVFQNVHQLYQEVTPQLSETMQTCIGLAEHAALAH